MNNKKQKFKSFVTTEYANDTFNKSVFKTDSGYILFGKYIINNVKNGFKITHENTEENCVFSNLKLATTWCIYHNKGMLSECNEIKYVDSRVDGISFDIHQIKTILSNTKDKDSKHIYINKLEEYILRITHFNSIAEKYINIANRWQIEQVNLISKR